MLDAAPGGDQEGALGRHLNPFRRKGEKPVVYWSGVLDSDSTRAHARVWGARLFQRHLARDGRRRVGWHGRRSTGPFARARRFRAVSECADHGDAGR